METRLWQCCVRIITDQVSARETLIIIARRHAHDSIKVGEVTGGPVYATEFYWPEELLDGRRLRVRIFALSGRPVDIAVDELLMTDCAGDRGAIDSMLSPGGR